MSNGSEHMHYKMNGMSKLHSVVKTMKILAAANIKQYEQAIMALDDYVRTIELGLSVFFRKSVQEDPIVNEKKENKRTYLVVFGSDQGLVGQFNDVVCQCAQDFLKTLPHEKHIWAVGERVFSLFEEAGVPVIDTYEVPNSVNAIAQLVGQILVNCQDYKRDEGIDNLYVIHNRLLEGMNYEPVLQRILPLDLQWQDELAKLVWPSSNLPEVLGGKEMTLVSLISEEIFIELYRACAYSLTSENACRLSSMQRAEKNIFDMMGVLQRDMQLVRQKKIDEELFDVIAGSETTVRKS